MSEQVKAGEGRVNIHFHRMAQAEADVFRAGNSWEALVRFDGLDKDGNWQRVWLHANDKTKVEALMALSEIPDTLKAAVAKCADAEGMADWEDSVAALGAGAEAVPELPGGGA